MAEDLDARYEFAITRMRNLYKRINSNVPDFNPFSLPTNNTVHLPYPDEVVRYGTITSKSLYGDEKVRILELKYYNNAELIKHTHMGYYELIFVCKGSFYTKRDKKVRQPNTKYVIDGDIPHNIQCNSGYGILLIAFSKDKKLLENLNIEQYCNLTMNNNE